MYINSTAFTGSLLGTASYVDVYPKFWGFLPYKSNDPAASGTSTID